MRQVLDFVCRLLESEAPGERTVAAQSDRQSAPPFGFPDIEAICRFAQPKQPWSFRLSFFGSNVNRASYLDEDGFYDFEKIDRLHRGGATVIVNQIHEFSGSIHRLKLRLEQILHCHVGVNCYATPMKAQGLARHVDSHDVVILQLHGQKRWQLFDRAPRAGGHYTMEGFDQAEPTDERILSPGDMLYLPAGFAHAAKSVEGATSLHLTVGFSPPTWKTLLGGWVNAAAQDDVTLNSELPAAMLRSDTPSPELEGLARSALGRVAATPFAAAHHQFAAYAASRTSVELDVQDPEVAFDALRADTLLSKAARVKGELFAGALRIRGVEGRLLELKRACESAWAEIDRRPAFRPRDIAGRVPEGTETLFCYYLLNNGLLTRS